MRRFQEGGLAQAQPDPDEQQNIFGIFSQLNMTNPAAQRWAEEYLEEFQGYDYAAEQELLEQFQETAEESRAALRRAREATLANEFDPSRRWFAMAEAFGKPTQTGAFGETLGNVGAALRPVAAARQQFDIDREGRLLELDQALGGIDTSLLGNEFKLRQLMRSGDTTLAKEAARILGKTVPPRGGAGGANLPPAIKSLDAKMATEYTDWVTGGQEFMLSKQALLTGAIEQLGTNDNLSGPWIGLIPKIARDIVMPEASNVQEVIETVAQESLKAILGGQFGQREGEMLLERTFNPRLEEAQNRKRAQALLLKIQRATEEKARAMQYFEDNQTMYGYDGKTDWSLDEFMPEEEMRRIRMVPGDDSTIIEVPGDWTNDEIKHFYETGQRPGEGEPVPGMAKGGRVNRYKQGGKVRKRRRRRKKYAAGGTVSGYAKKEKSPQSLHLKYGKRARFQEGGDVEDFDEDDDVEDFGVSPGAMPGPGAVGLGVAGGAAVGLGVEEIGTRIHEGVTGTVRPSRAEQVIGTSMELGGVEPAEAVAEVKRGRRQGVPSVLMDESGNVTQRLTERAMIGAGTPGDDALEMILTRQEHSGERVGRQVEKNLRTPEFHSSESQLTDRLYSRAKPYYQKAYAEAPAMKFPKFWDDWFERPYSQAAIRQANEFMAAQGKNVGPTDATGVARSFSLEYLDEVKKAFDQMIRQEERTAGYSPKRRIMVQQRSQLMTYLDKNAPEAYKLAREQYKGDLEVLEALDIGRKEFHRLSPEEARLTLEDMSFSERGALRTGVAQHIYDVIYNPSTNVDAARRMLGSQNMRQRLQLLFDKPSDWRIFEAALNREMKMFSSDKTMARRVESGRTGRLVGQALAADDPLASMKNAMSRGPLMWVIRTIGWGRKAGGLSEQQADEVIEILTNRDLKELEKYVPQLEYARDYARTRRGRRGKAAVIGGATGLGIAAYEAAAGEDEPEFDEQDLATIREALRIQTEYE